MNIKTAEKFSVNEIIRIHTLMAEHFARFADPVSPPGVKDRAMLESAAARPFQTVERKAAYGTIYQKAAALFHGLIQNHPFYNGNKRTALIAAQILLARQNLWLHNTYDEELFEFTRKTAAHELSDRKENEVADIAEWFAARTRKVKKGGRPLTYRALRNILERLGFTIDEPRGELLNIYKQGHYVDRVIKRGVQGFAPYDIDYIAGLRKRLGLVPENGCDSTVFYGAEDFDAMISELIDLRIEIMERLAKI